MRIQLIGVVRSAARSVQAILFRVQFVSRCPDMANANTAKWCGPIGRSIRPNHGASSPLWFGFPDMANADTVNWFGPIGRLQAGIFRPQSGYWNVCRMVRSLGWARSTSQTIALEYETMLETQAFLFRNFRPAARQISFGRKAAAERVPNGPFLRMSKKSVPNERFDVRNQIWNSAFRFVCFVAEEKSAWQSLWFKRTTGDKVKGLGFRV